MRFFKKPDELQKEKWEKLHREGYHPSLREAMEQVKFLPEGKGWIFEDWARRLQMDIDVKDKVILEIGFGGGWYLAQILQHRARKVIGFEASRTAMNKAKELLNQLELTNYELFLVDERYFDVLPRGTVDLVFEHTVFQHITEQATRNYLRSATSILKQPTGVFIAQFLMNDEVRVKDPYGKGKKEGIMYYSRAEVERMTEDCGYDIVKSVDHGWSDGKGSYWRYYVLKPG